MRLTSDRSLSVGARPHLVADDSAKGSLTTLLWTNISRHGGRDVPQQLDRSHRRFCRLKAGDNKANHSHLDLGSFVLDALGQSVGAGFRQGRLQLPATSAGTLDLLPAARRSTNTLVINPAPVPIKTRGRRAHHPLRLQTRRAFAIADLTGAYAPHVRKPSAVGNARPQDRARGRTNSRRSAGRSLVVHAHPRPASR